MKLIPGNSQSIIVTNIKALQSAGYDPARAQAIAFHNAGRARFQGKSHKKSGMKIGQRLAKKVRSKAPPSPESYPIANTGFRLGE